MTFETFVYLVSVVISLVGAGAAGFVLHEVLTKVLK